MRRWRARCCLGDACTPSAQRVRSRHSVCARWPLGHIPATEPACKTKAEGADVCTARCVSVCARQLHATRRCMPLGADAPPRWRPRSCSHRPIAHHVTISFDNHKLPSCRQCPAIACLRKAESAHHNQRHNGRSRLSHACGSPLQASGGGWLPAAPGRGAGAARAVLLSPRAGAAQLAGGRTSSCGDRSDGTAISRCGAGPPSAHPPPPPSAACCPPCAPLTASCPRTCLSARPAASSGRWDGVSSAIGSCKLGEEGDACRQAILE